MKKRIKLTEDKFRKIVKKCVNEEVMNSNVEVASGVLNAIHYMWKRVAPRDLERAVTKLERYMKGEFTDCYHGIGSKLYDIVNLSIDIIPSLERLEDLLCEASDEICDKYNV